jgi:hypothetical protein
MPRYSVSSDKVNAGELILPKGEYSFSLGEPTLFHRTRDDGSEVYGVRYPFTIVSEGPHHGQRIRNQDMYLHTPGAARMTKRFLMAALDFDANSQVAEAEFNSQFPDLGIDPDANYMDEVFSRVTGKIVRAAVDVQENRIREGEMQNTFRWLVG